MRRATFCARGIGYPAAYGMSRFISIRRGPKRLGPIDERSA